MKNGNMIYLFDFDGTLFGQEKWEGIWKNWKLNFSKEPYFNPHDFDIRWSILTGRPKVDKFLIWICCIVNGLFPEKIITIPTLRYPFKNDEEKFEWKLKEIQSILSDNQNIFDRQITKLVYIDNDLKTVDYLNSKRLNSGEYLAVTVSDFINHTYNFLL